MVRAASITRSNRIRPSSRTQVPSACSRTPANAGLPPAAAASTRAKPACGVSSAPESRSPSRSAVPATHVNSAGNDSVSALNGESAASSPIAPVRSGMTSRRSSGC